MAPSVIPVRVRLSVSCQLVTKLPTSQTASSTSRPIPSTFVSCWETRGRTANIGLRAVGASAAIDGAPPPLSSLARFDQVRVGIDDLGVPQLAVGGLIDRHRALVGVARVIDREVAQHGVAELDAEQVLADRGTRAVGLLDRLQQH